MRLSEFVLLGVVFLVQSSVQVSLQEDLTLTYSQKLILDKFRDAVSPHLPHAYMKEDIYLIRWLRARNFNFKAAESMLLENIRWRKEKKMDTILKEDWSSFERDFRASVEGCDKEGRPVVSVYVGDWDVRKAVVAGKSERMMRYFDKLFEEMAIMIRKMQAEGQNVTQFDEIFEMGNYNLALQGCPTCIPVYVYLFQSWESHFPGGVHRITLVNVPSIFQSLWVILRPLLAPQTRNIVSLYGRDKAEWKYALLQEIDERQLTKGFGGVKEDPFEFEDLRKNNSDGVSIVNCTLS